jgi:metal-responsive CopG/Arc/MetJ family transcriptional regulator
VDSDVDQTPHVETIQVVLGADLLRAADRAVRRLKTNRSALLRDALRAYLASLDLREREARDREGYARYPDSLDQPAAWDKVADWPEE